MYFTFIGVVVLLITLFLVFFTRTRTLFYFMFFISAFTSASMINFPNFRNSILCYYIVGSFLILKVIYEVIIGRYSLKKIKVVNGLLWFLIYAAISFLIPIFYSYNTLVFTPDSPYDYISFSSQNITQYLYLLFAFIVYLCSYIVIVNEVKVDIKKIIDITVVVVLILGFIQFFISHEYFDFLFRTNYTHTVQYLETGLTRISSVTDEPSMFSMFLAPIFVYYFVQILNQVKNKRIIKFDIIMFILILVTFILNRASSFYLSLLIVSAILLIDFWKFIFSSKNKEIIKKYFNEKILTYLLKNKIKSFFIIVVLFGAVLVLFKIVGFRFLILFLKLFGIGDSGSTRVELFSYHMSVFLKNILTGVGFGTLRSNDLLSMWSAQVGLLGMIPVIHYFSVRLIYIFKNRNFRENRAIFYLIITTIIILVTSVPEPYYIYTWIYIAIVESIYQESNHSNNIAINRLVKT